MKIRILLSGLAAFTSLKAFANETPAYLGVVNKADGTASFINLETQQTDLVINVGYFPHEITSSPDGSKVFVTNYGKEHVRSTSPKNHPGNTVSIIDMKNKSKSGELQLGTDACAPHGVLTSADGKRIYITCEDRQEVLVIDAVKNEISHSVPTLQAQSHMVTITADESRAYTANFSPGTVTALDLKNRTILKQISVGPGTEGVALSPNKPFVYATSVLGGFLVKIDTNTLEIVQKVATDRSPVRVLPSPDGKLLVVNNSADGTVQIFDADTLDLIKRIKVGRQPIGLVVPNNDYAYTANMLDNSVSVINLKTMQVTSELKTGSKPDGITYIPASK
ncbi:cytochrome D1 domain-containing protein [Bdellovibrio bacteriovorus]|uniref:cytochrome D1 domain-containing protein n=1 Tax=Bdellovibrio bacteriovorus TaxID=959 RepID=UPI0035A8FC46